MSKEQQRVLKLHGAQVRLFRRTARGIQREFGKQKVAESFLPAVNKLVELIDEQIAAAQGIFAIAPTLPSTGNPNTALLNSDARHHVYPYLTSMRLASEQIGDLDEWNKALAAAADLLKEAARHPDDKEAQSKAGEMGWRLFCCQSQIHSLARQADALTATEEALMRSFGLKFWQGHKRHLRWEGDRDSEV